MYTLFLGVSTTKVVIITLFLNKTCECLTKKTFSIITIALSLERWKNSNSYSYVDDPVRPPCIANCSTFCLAWNKTTMEHFGVHLMSPLSSLTTILRETSINWFISKTPYQRIMSQMGTDIQQILLIQ